jgi:hypothetical protein
LRLPIHLGAWARWGAIATTAAVEGRRRSIRRRKLEDRFARCWRPAPSIVTTPSAVGRGILLLLLLVGLLLLAIVATVLIEHLSNLPLLQKSKRAPPVSSIRN